MPTESEGSIKQTHRQETSPKKPHEYRPFKPHEMEILKKYGNAVFIDLAGEETIEGYQKARRQFSFISNYALKTPSIKAQIAIFPKPEKFFVPGIKGKTNLAKCEKSARKDARKLRKKTGIKDLDIIIPDEASTIVAIILNYFDKTNKDGKGIWLLGPDFGRSGVESVITKQRFGFEGSAFITVGPVTPRHGGVHVGEFKESALNFPMLRIARIMVARKR